MTDQQDQDIDGFFSTARVSGHDGAIALPTESYRGFLFDHDDPVLAEWRGLDYTAYAKRRTAPPFVQDLLRYWNGLYEEPFVGITADGVVQDGLYPLDAAAPPDTDAQRAAEDLLAVLSAEERARFRHSVDAPEWRAWSNPEFTIYRVGLRLEDLSEEKVSASLRLLEASLSPEGYRRVREVMRLNGYLGELTDLPTIMNDRSYWISLFGTPSGTAPWGWQIFGHHLALNVVSVGGREVIAPVFLGGEPALSDDEHPPLFAERERQAIELASSLTPQQRASAVVYESVLDPSMPEGRLHPADERHLAGAFRDNRVIPYEGLRASALDDRQRALLRSIVADFHLLLKEPQREATLADVDAHLDETWFSWYGATDGSQPFYFRIQSPVVVAELDHHAGVWLDNRLPARFHVHTTLRLPNGNDYGHAYIAEWRRRERLAGRRRTSVYAEGFAHANPVPAACRVGPLLFSGVVTGRETSTRELPPTLDEQAALMFQHVREVVEAGGGSTGDIVKLTVWLADLGERAALNREWTRMFPDPEDRPTRHALAGSLEPGKLIECEFVAVIGGMAGS